MTYSDFFVVIELIAQNDIRIKSYRCAISDREFELSDSAVPDKRDGKTPCTPCLLGLE